MEHVVFYPSADGSPAFRRVGSLDDAVRFVEHLRNIEDISDFSVHALTEVPLHFRAFYRVEVPNDSAVAEVTELPTAAAAPADPQPLAAVPAPAEPSSDEVDEVDEAAADGRKSLGFFAR